MQDKKVRASAGAVARIPPQDAGVIISILAIRCSCADTTAWHQQQQEEHRFVELTIVALFFLFLAKLKSSFASPFSFLISHCLG